MQKLITYRLLPFRLGATILALLLLPYTVVIAQCTLSCKSSLQVSLDENGQVMLTVADVAPTTALNCPNDLSLSLLTQQGAPLSNPLTCAQAGTTVVARVKNIISGNYCSTNISVKDLLPPVVNCQERFVSCSADTDPAVLGHPDWADNCTDNCTASHSDLVSALSCNTLQNGIPVVRRIDRTWYVRDKYNNESTCHELIWIKRPDVTKIVFPPNLDDVALPSLNCVEDPLNLDLTGRPMLDENMIESSGPCALGVGFNDQKIAYCGTGGYVILRHWTIVGACSSDYATATQTIRVADKTAPTMVPPSPVTVNTSPFSCNASVTLAKGTATDDCSTVTISATWPFGTGFGPFNNVPKGTHTVTYTATDACGNTESATATVVVVDNTPPQVLCTPGLQVSLTSGGNALIAARTLDAGSADNCGGALTFEIERDNGIYGPDIVFSCADVGKTIPVSLRVKDEGGLENFCQVSISVRDLLRPTIQCPPAVTIGCTQNFQDTTLTKWATATDNCTLKSFVRQDVLNLDACNIGSVVRTWTATDNSDNVRSCSQTITLVPQNTIAVTFPANITVSNCTAPSALMPDATGRPVITGVSCSPLSVTFNDVTYSSALPPACTRIERTWKIIDFCIYNVNQPAAGGYWEKIQVINIVDQTPPALTIPPDMTISAAQADCMAAINLSDALATDCGGPVTITNNSVYATAAQKNASGIYPVGIHQILFTATDVCGNTTQQTLKLTVTDHTPPTVTCRNNVVLYISANGTAIPTVAAINGGAVDNCATANSLSFELVPESFDCSQVGPSTVTLLVADPTGNSTACQSTVLILDTLFRCSQPAAISVSGQIRNYAGVPVNEIPVQLTGVGMRAFTACDTTGHYLFEDVIATDTCSIRPFNNNNWLNGVSTLDLALISRHILNIEPLNSPYKMIAADANRSGTITTLDIVAIRRLILGIQDSVPNSTSWRFIPADFVFPNAQNPFQAPFPEFISLNNPNKNITSGDFIGVKLGDLNGSADPIDPRAPIETAFIETPDQAFNAGATITVPLNLTQWQQTAGLQWELGWAADMLELDSVIYVQPAIFNAAHCAQPAAARLSVSWNPTLGAMPSVPQDTPPVLLQFKAKHAGVLHDGLFLNEKRLRAELYRDGNIVPVKLTFTKPYQTPKHKKINAIYPNSPNPFSDFTLIPFSVSAPATVALKVADQYGRVLHSEQQECAIGEHHFSLRRDQLGAPGVYFYEISSGEQVFNGKMLTL